jgi:hypothetical protein
MSSSETPGTASYSTDAASAADYVPVTESKSVSDIDRLLELKRDINLHERFQVFLQRNGGQLDQYSHRWLRDRYGRVCGGEEQWQFHVSQLRKFFEHEQQLRDRRSGWFWRLREFLKQLFR